LVSEVASGGQLDVWPEYSVAGIQVSGKDLQADGSGHIGGFKYQISKDVQEVVEEFKGRHLLVRPSAITQWLGKYQAKGLPIIDRASGNRVCVRSAGLELDASLRPDDSLVVQGALTTEEGLEISSALIQPIPGEPEWFRLEETIYRRPEVSAALVSVIDAGQPGKIFSGDEVPELLAEIQQNPKKIRSVRKNPKLEAQGVSIAEPQNSIRVDGDADTIRVQETITYPRPGGATLDQSVEEVEALLGATKKRAYRRVEEGWIRVERSHVEDAQRKRTKLPRRAQQRAAIQGVDIPETLAALAALAMDLQQGTPWNIVCSKRVERNHRLLDIPAEVSFPVSVVDLGSGENVLQIQPTYQHEKTNLSHNSVGESIARNERWVRGQRVWIKLDRAKHQAVQGFIDREQLKPTSTGGYIIRPPDWDRLRDELEALGKIEQTDSFREFMQKLLEFDRIEHVQTPAALVASLRPYQQHGLNWLVFLRKFGLNGILADDMGLGKTIQTLAAIAHSREHQARGSHHPSLIICPPSLIGNWSAEAQKFLRNVRIVVYRGPDRDRLLPYIHTMADIVITSYDTAASDSKKLDELPWNYLIVDEAHAIRNADTQRAKGIKKIGAARKLALTGTPVQNSAKDLWSLFDFAMPGYLDSGPNFERRYPSLCGRRTNLNPQEANGLHKRTRPFLLRRLKREVARDLPEIVESDRIVELSNTQEQLYRGVLEERGTRELVGQVQRGEHQKHGINILQLLSKLRHVCNDPTLVRGGAVDAAESAKLMALAELLEEVKGGGHRALIFSQFTRVLDILEERLVVGRYKYLRLDGGTPNDRRQPLVDQFNRDSSYDCFLISTKAGGVGLNLTGADTVIFFDHDWNPQNDEQARARAHRIGQTKTVTVYRLVTKGTIEERMLSIQDRKKRLAQALVTETPQGFLNISREELLSLFEYQKSSQ